VFVVRMSPRVTTFSILAIAGAWLAGCGAYDGSDGRDDGMPWVLPPEQPGPEQEQEASPDETDDDLESIGGLAVEASRCDQVIVFSRFSSADIATAGGTGGSAGSAGTAGAHDASSADGCNGGEGYTYDGGNGCNGADGAVGDDQGSVLASNTSASVGWPPRPCSTRSAWNDLSTSSSSFGIGIAAVDNTNATATAGASRIAVRLSIRVDRDAYAAELFERFGARPSATRRTHS
jgi:hypothetical protein